MSIYSLRLYNKQQGSNLSIGDFERVTDSIHRIRVEAKLNTYYTIYPTDKKTRFFNLNSDETLSVFVNNPNWVCLNSTTTEKGLLPYFILPAETVEYVYVCIGKNIKHCMELLSNL
mgnify:CR=1 FL=1